jgi:hypothetical protein
MPASSEVIDVLEDLLSSVIKPENSVICYVPLSISRPQSLELWRRKVKFKWELAVKGHGSWRFSGNATGRCHDTCTHDFGKPRPAQKVDIAFLSWGITLRRYAWQFHFSCENIVRWPLLYNVSGWIRHDSTDILPSRNAKVQVCNLSVVSILQSSPKEVNVMLKVPKAYRRTAHCRLDPTGHRSQATHERTSIVSW